MEIVLLLFNINMGREELNPRTDLVSMSRLSRPRTATCLDWHRGRRNRRRLVGSLELTISELRLLDWSCLITQFNSYDYKLLQIYLNVFFFNQMFQL